MLQIPILKRQTFRSPQVVLVTVGRSRSSCGRIDQLTGDSRSWPVSCSLCRGSEMAGGGEYISLLNVTPKRLFSAHDLKGQRVIVRLLSADQWSCDGLDFHTLTETVWRGRNVYNFELHRENIRFYSSR